MVAVYNGKFWRYNKKISLEMRKKLADIMKRKSHDYTKPAEAESLLYSAQRLIANDCIYDAEKRIIEAREILLQYLSQDNEIEEDYL